MLTHEVEVEAPFRSVQHALRDSFAREGQDIYKRSSVFASRAMSARTDLTPFDRAAQAAEIIRLAHENCRLTVIYAISALYMPPDCPARGVLISKADAVVSCVEHVFSYPHLSGYRWDYVMDMVASWAGAQPVRTQAEWVAELGVSSRTLQRIQYGNRERGRPGIMQILDDLIDEGVFNLLDVFRDRGLVGPKSEA